MTSVGIPAPAIVGAPLRENTGAVPVGVPVVDALVDALVLPLVVAPVVAEVADVPDVPVVPVVPLVPVVPVVAEVPVDALVVVVAVACVAVARSGTPVNCATAPGATRRAASAKACTRVRRGIVQGVNE